MLQSSSHPYVESRGTTVVFAPHPDDEALGCGALIARKRNVGLPVHVVFLTDGSASHTNHPRVTPTEVNAIRLQEARRVLSVLGVDSASIHFFNEPDGTLNQLSTTEHESLVGRLTALLQQLEPDEIFLPCHADGSSEHEAAFGFVVEAASRAGLHALIWEYPVWLWWNPLTLLLRVVHAAERCRAPVEDYLPVKRQALALYRSQLEPLPPQIESSLPHDLLRLIDTEAEYFFWFAPIEPKSARPVI